MDFETADIQLSDIKKLSPDEQEYFRRWVSKKLMKLHKRQRRITSARREAENEIDFERSE